MCPGQLSFCSVSLETTLPRLLCQLCSGRLGQWEALAEEQAAEENTMYFCYCVSSWLSSHQVALLWSQFSLDGPISGYGNTSFPLSPSRPGCAGSSLLSSPLGSPIGCVQLLGSSISRQTIPLSEQPRGMAVFLTGPDFTVCLVL